MRAATARPPGGDFPAKEAGPAAEGDHHSYRDTRNPGRAPQIRACKGVASARPGRTLLASIVIDPALPVGSTRSGRGPATVTVGHVGSRLSRQRRPESDGLCHPPASQLTRRLRCGRRPSPPISGRPGGPATTRAAAG